MHPFNSRWPDDPSWRPPPIGSTVFRDARDVVAHAELEPITLQQTWPETWHLDLDGRLRCGSRGSSLDTIRALADDPEDMLACRCVPTGDDCPDNWVVIEYRHPLSAISTPVTEQDAACFLRLRRELSGHGVHLLDVIVVGPRLRWWSLHELTSGTTAWAFGPSGC